MSIRNCLFSTAALDCVLAENIAKFVGISFTVRSVVRIHTPLIIQVKHFLVALVHQVFDVHRPAMRRLQKAGLPCRVSMMATNIGWNVEKTILEMLNW